MNYEEMVKTAYEDIMDSFEKEAANALGKNIQARPGAMHSEFMRRGASAGHASNLINDYRGAVSGQRRMEGILGKQNMSSIYPESIDKVHDSLRKVNSAMRTPASAAQGASLQRTNARRMQQLLPSVKTAFEKEAVDFDALNKQTRDWNNGISRNISPTPSGRPGSGSRMKASDLLANFNNYTYKQNNGAYPSRLYK